MQYLMTDANSSTVSRSSFVKSAPESITQSDIRAIVRAELTELYDALDDASPDDKMSKIHVKDAKKRIEEILELED